MQVSISKCSYPIATYKTYLLHHSIFFTEQSQSKADTHNSHSLLARKRSVFRMSSFSPTDTKISLTHHLILYAFAVWNCLSTFNINGFFLFYCSYFFSTLKKCIVAFLVGSFFGFSPISS